MSLTFDVIFVQDLKFWKIFRLCVIFPKQNLSENFVILITNNAIDSSQDEFYDIARTVGLTIYYTLLPEVTIMKYQMVIDCKGFSSNYFKYLPDIINYIKISKPFQVS